MSAGGGDGIGGREASEEEKSIVMYSVFCGSLGRLIPEGSPIYRRIVGVGSLTPEE